MSSLLAYMVLIGLLVVSNWAQCIHIISWVSSLVSYWLTTPTILTLYGLVLLYLLFAVHALAVAQESSTKRRKSTLAPYYDEDGKLQGWVREEGREVENANPNLTPSLLKGPLMDSDSTLTSWDGFPNHRFRCQFTRQQVEDTSQLAVYWVADKLPGGKRGSLAAVTPEKGRLSHFQCAGIIQCKAAVEWAVVFYRDGAIFQNSGRHDHSTYTHSLPVSKRKTLGLQEFVSKHPIALTALRSPLPASDDSDSQTSSRKEITLGNVEDDQSSDNSHNDEDEVDLNLNASKSQEEMDSEDEMMLDSHADESEEGHGAGH
ncbi:hypothetical protein C8R46DRAFT_1247009 [Mycena filopes]|nr:hypothetical protein C8R46DRAFT_1247009 [Mycena filopes]